MDGERPAVICRIPGRASARRAGDGEAASTCATCRTGSLGNWGKERTMERTALLLLLGALPSLVLGLSGGFYADNRKQQSVLYKPLGKRDKQELEQEILGLLGLDHRPKPRRQEASKTSAPTRFLLELYNDPRATSGSDLIVSFVNRIHHKAPHLRHERNRRFWFDVGSEIPPEEEIVSAELRIYRDPEHEPEQPDAVYALELYAVLEKNSLELVDEVLVTSHEKGWLIFNVTGPAIIWSAFPENNNGLYMKIRSSASARSYDPEELGIVGPKGVEEKQPFLVIYFRTASELLHVRKTRAAKKRQHDSYYDPTWNPYTNSQDTYPSRRSCQRLTLYVSFRDLGWQDWIIAPDGYGAFFCHGECSFPLNAHMNATNHAIVQTLVHLMDPLVVPKPCCAPTQLSAITVLYFDDNSNVILKKYRNMVVKSCGCH